MKTTTEKLARIITKSYNLNVEIGPGLKPSITSDGKTIMLPDMGDTLTGDVLDLFRGLIDHECAHGLFTQLDYKGVFQKKFAPEYKEKALDVLCWLEDTRIEKKMSKEYRGSKTNIERMNSILLENSELEVLGWPAFLLAISFLGRDSEHKYLDKLPSETVELARKYEDQIKRAVVADSTVDCADISEEIFRDVIDEFEQEPEEGGESSPESQNGDSEDSSTEGDTEDSGTDAGDSNTDNSGAGDGEEVSEENKKSESVAGETGETDEDGFDKDEIIDDLLREELEKTEGGLISRIFSTKYDVIKKLDNSVDKNRKDIISEAFDSRISVLTRKLERLLKAKDRNRWRHGDKRGKLDPRLLHKVRTGETSVFRRKVYEGEDKPACLFLYDLSYSMHGRRNNECKKLLYIFGEVLESIKAPFEIVSFNTSGNALAQEIQTIASDPSNSYEKNPYKDPILSSYIASGLKLSIVKEFSDNWRTGIRKIPRLRAIGMTPLGRSIDIVGGRLVRRKEKRKILFVLTDGKAGEDHLSDDRSRSLWRAKGSLSRAKKAGLEVVGIGIKIAESYMEKLFSEYVMVNNIEDDKSEFVQELERVLLRGGR